MSLKLTASSKKLNAALQNILESNDDPVIYVQGVPFKLQSVTRSVEPHTAMMTKLTYSHMTEGDDISIELEAVECIETDDTIHIGDTVYCKDSAAPAIVIGQSQHEVKGSDETVWVVEQVNKVRVHRVRESHLTKTKPLIPKNGEIWECEMFSAVTPVRKITLCCIEGFWRYTPADSDITSYDIKPIRKLGEIE